MKRGRFTAILFSLVSAAATVAFVLEQVVCDETKIEGLFDVDISCRIEPKPTTNH